MTKLNSSILILALLPLVLTGITSFWDMNPVNSQSLQCLRHTGYLDQAFTLAVYQPTTQQWNVATSLQDINQAGAKAHLILSTAQIEGKLPPQLEAHRVAAQFSKAPLQRLWISISNFPGSFRPSCEYLKTFATFLHLFSKKNIGFQSESLFWQDLFDDKMGCPQLSKYPLYLSFNNFSPFGGWTSYVYYQTYRPVPVCNYPGMQVFKK